MMDQMIILGAGYAGMMTASHFDRRSAPFTLINKNPYHYFTTLLHEVAGGRAVASKYSVPLTDLLKKPTSHIMIDQVTAIDRQRRMVHLESGEERFFDWLAITLGSVPEYFGIPGLAKYSLVLDSLDAAKRIRTHIVREIEMYLRDRDIRHLRIVVGGGGLTGVELLGELLDWLPELCLTYDVDRKLFDLQNIEASSGILPQLSRGLREQATQLLTQKGAKLSFNKKIIKVSDGVVHLQGGEVLQAGTIIWTGGVRANPILEEAGFSVDRRGRARVNEFLQSVDDDHIFIGGDSAWCDGEDGRPIPPTAQMAAQMGTVMAHNIEYAKYGQEMKSFHPHSMGTLASLGRQAGVGEVLGMPVHGMIGGMFKESTKVKYLWELGGLRLLGQRANRVSNL